MSSLPPPSHPTKDDALIALPYIRARSLFSSRIAAIVAGIWLVAMLILAGFSISGPIALSAFFLPLIALCIGMPIWINHWQRSSRAAARSAQYLACPTCLYDLRASRDSKGQVLSSTDVRTLTSPDQPERWVSCPECGKLAAIHQSSLLWKAWTGDLPPPATPTVTITRDDAARELLIVRRRFYWVGATLVLLLGVYALFLFGVSAMPAASSTRDLILRFAFVPPILCFAIAYIVGVIWHRWLNRTVRSVNFQACPECLYDLRGAALRWQTYPLEPDATESPPPSQIIQCPECGKQLDPTRNAAAWRVWLGT